MSPLCFVDDLNGFFTSDLGYNKVHLWMGQGVTDQHIKNWAAATNGIQHPIWRAQTGYLSRPRRADRYQPVFKHAGIYKEFPAGHRKGRFKRASHG